MNDRIVRKIYFNTFSVQMMSVLASLISMVLDGMVTGSCLGVMPMAAYGIALPIINIYTALGGACSTGISTVCGRVVGEGDVKGTNRVFSIGMELSFLLAVIVMLVTVVGAEPIAVLFGARGEALPMAVDFLRGYGCCAPAMFLVTVLIAVLQIDGDMKLVFASTVTMTVVNVSLDLLNGFVLHWGLWGMGIATTASFYAAFGVIMLHFLKKDRLLRFSITPPNVKDLLEIGSYGIPYSVQQLCRSLLVICMNHIILSISDNSAVAAYTAMTSAGNLCLCIGTGAGRAVTMLGSVFWGERDKSSMIMLLKDSLKYTAILNVVVSLTLFFAADWLMPLFLRNGEGATEMACTAFRYFVLCTVFFSVNVIVKSFYQAIHRLKMAYAYILLDNFASITLCGFVLGHLFGLTGIWLSNFAGETLTLVVFLILILVQTRSEDSLLERVALLPEGFDKDVLQVHESSVSTKEQVVDASEVIHKSSLQVGCPPTLAFCIALSAEEMAGNIVRHGFTDQKEYSVDIRLTKTPDSWILRIRDDCPAFNPVEYLAMLNTEDPISHIGIRMVRSLSQKMEYFYSLNMNTLILTFAA